MNLLRKKVKKTLSGTKSKLIDEYWIESYTSGIVAVIFDTKLQWVDGYQMGDTYFEFNGQISWGYVSEKNKIEDETIEVPEMETYEALIKGDFITTVSKSKRQIIFYYIPRKLLEEG